MISRRAARTLSSNHLPHSHYQCNDKSQKVFLGCNDRHLVCL